MAQPIPTREQLKTLLRYTDSTSGQFHEKPQALWTYFLDCQEESFWDNVEAGDVEGAFYRLANETLHCFIEEHVRGLS